MSLILLHRGNYELAQKGSAIYTDAAGTMRGIGDHLGLFHFLVEQASKTCTIPRLSGAPFTCECSDGEPSRSNHRILDMLTQQTMP